MGPRAHDHFFEINRYIYGNRKTFRTPIFFVGCSMVYFRRGLTSLFNDYLPRLSPTHKKPDLKPQDIGLLGIIELMIGIIVILIMNSDMILSRLK